MFHQIRVSIGEFIDEDSPQSRPFQLISQFLIVVSLITFSIETLPDLTPTAHMILAWIEGVIVVIFSIEYVIRVIAAPSIRRYVMSFYGVVDLLAILPFYLALGIDLRAVRIVRMLRLMRLFKLVRYSQAAYRLQRAFVVAKDEIVLFLVVSMMLLYIMAIGIYYFEHDAQPDKFRSVFDSFWWAVGTLTTVGYGDMYPVTAGGRIFTFVVLVIGLGIVAVPTGLFASALLKVNSELSHASDESDTSHMNRDV